MRYSSYVTMLSAFWLAPFMAGCSGGNNLPSTPSSEEQSIDNQPSTGEDTSATARTPNVVMPIGETISEPGSPPQERDALPPEPETPPPVMDIPSAGSEDPTREPFTISGLFSVSSPGNGYQWQLARRMQVGDVSGSVYACVKEGSTSVITLGVQEHTADTDAKRTAMIKAHYNGIYQALTNGGFTQLKGTKPSLESPIPDQVPFSFSCRKPDGSAAFVHGLTMFGKNVYSLDVMAGTLKQANEFIDVAKTFKELAE